MKTGSFFQKYCFFTLYYMPLSPLTVFFKKIKNLCRLVKCFTIFAT